MAVSPRRVSKSRKGMRNSHSSLDVAPLTSCSNCSRYIKFHSVCSCGYYRGKKVVPER